MNRKNGVVAQVEVRIELFGVPRLVSGARELAVRLPETLSEREFAAALAEACPPLLGRVICDDLTGLMQGYVLNLNGLAFLGGLTSGIADSVRLKPGDTLLLLSNQAGG